MICLFAMHSENNKAIYHDVIDLEKSFLKILETFRANIDSYYSPLNDTKIISFF